MAFAAEEMIQLEDLPENVVDGPVYRSLLQSSGFYGGGCELRGSTQEIELGFIMEAMRRTGGVKKRAAGILGLSFRSFRYRLQKAEYF